MSAAASGRAAAALLALLLAGAAGALELSPQEALGKRLFREGRGAAGEILGARVGPQSVAVTGAPLPCAGCHGADGKGKPEGGLRPPEITWQELAKPYGHRHDNGREHPAFDEASFGRAVSEGIDPAGRRLDPAMPRYALAASDAAALAAYLRRIGDDHDPGLAPAALRIGSVVPKSGPLAETGAMVAKLLQGAFDDINAGGGIHGRRLELAVIDAAGPQPLRERLQAAEVFALAAPLVPGRTDELAALAEESGLPVVGPLGGEGGAEGRYTFRLAPGEREQARALVEFAASRLGLADPEIALVLPPGKPELAAAVEGQLGRRGWTRIRRAAPGQEAATVAAWQAGGVAAVFHFGPREALAELQRAAAAAGWQPAFLAPAALAGAAGGRLYVALPALPGEGSAAGRSALERLRTRLGLPARQPTVQAAAYAAAAVLAEGLKRAGRAASRARLVDTLENLYAYDTGVMPPLGFGPGRRVGVMGAHVLAVDPAAGAWRPAGGFVQLERED